jgi:mRNA-degrading endonuclease HigB of HigAB toxin-antitoxin module
LRKKRLLEAATEYSDISTQLESWYRTAKRARWRNLRKVRQTYSHADGVRVGEKVYTVQGTIFDW